MNKIKRENSFVVAWFCCTIILVGLCNLGFVRGTMAGFGGMTGQLTSSYVINYLSNYPSELGLSEQTKIESVVYNDYVISGNDFILEGYEFVNWNTSSDGLGDTYLVDDSIVLEKSITLYAQWKKIEVINISYGDVNINGQIDEEDYLLVENSVNNRNNLTGQALLNADVNNDGKVDLVDADIIKQAYLGTEGYNNCLPSQPILKYELYVDESNGDDDLGNEDGNISSDNNVEKPSGDEDNSSGNTNSSVSGSNSGTGNRGSGNASSGTGSSGNTSSDGGTGSNKPSSSTSSSYGGNQSGSSSKEEDKKEEELVNNNNEENNETSETDKKDEKPVSGNNNIEDADSGKESYVWIIVVVMCLVSLRLIVYVIDKFKEKENASKYE